MVNGMLTGALSVSGEDHTTYFYRGISHAELDAITEVCRRTGLKEEIEEDRVILVAVESTKEPYQKGRYVGVAYMCKTGRISLMTCDELRSDYMKMYLEEVFKP